MGDKDVTSLPGIGDAYGRKLKEKGFGKAKDVVQHFLQLNQDKEKFLGWLKEVCMARSDCGEKCYRCLKEYLEAHSV